MLSLCDLAPKVKLTVGLVHYQLLSLDCYWMVCHVMMVMLLVVCRFLRVRPDKAVEDASGPDLVQQLYNRQNRRVH